MAKRTDRKWIWIGIMIGFFAFGLSGLFGMQIEIGGGYRFAPSSFNHNGFNIDLGIWNEFNDRIEFDITYHPHFSFDDEGTQSETPMDFWNFDFGVYVPILGRDVGRTGYRFGIHSTFEYGNFYTQYSQTGDDPTDQDLWNAWQDSSYWFAAGLYGQYHFDPWLFEVSLGLPIVYNPQNMGFMDLLFGTVQAKLRYFVQSGQYQFRDHLVVEFQLSNRKIGFSVYLIMPF